MSREPAGRRFGQTYVTAAREGSETSLTALTTSPVSTYCFSPARLRPISLCIILRTASAAISAPRGPNYIWKFIVRVTIESVPSALTDQVLFRDFIGMGRPLMTS